MMAIKPIPMTVDEFVKSATMFYIDHRLEDEFEDRIVSSANDIKDHLVGITTPEGLKQYIKSDADALNKLISLLNISKERFKRVITMLRLQRHHSVTTEWDLPKIRTQMITDNLFMNDVCELLMSGSTSEKYKSLIPAFVLENFAINVSTLGRLADADDIRRLVKKNVEGDYNIKIGSSFFTQAQKSITEICDKVGLLYSINKDVLMVGRVINIAIPDETNPRLLIDITYGITTSSSQSTYADIAEATAEKLRNRNHGKPNGEKVFFINVLDGAGWVARQSDLNRIHRCSDYLFNLTSLNKIADVINYIFGGINQ